MSKNFEDTVEEMFPDEPGRAKQLIKLISNELYIELTEIENFPRVPMEMMNYIQERKKDLTATDEVSSKTLAGTPGLAKATPVALTQENEETV